MTPPSQTPRSQRSRTQSPWWAEVAHLRDAEPEPRRHRAHREESTRLSAPTGERAVVDQGLIDLSGQHEIAPLRPDTEPARAESSSRGSRSLSRGRRRAPSEVSSTDWFADEARAAGRRSAPRAAESVRPRALLVDVEPDRAWMARKQQVRRAPGERPTVKITGRPDAALPPRVREERQRRSNMPRPVRALIASPDRFILWAIALGMLMIVAAFGTAGAQAATVTPPAIVAAHAAPAPAVVVQPSAH